MLCVVREVAGKSPLLFNSALATFHALHDIKHQALQITNHRSQLARKQNASIRHEENIRRFCILSEPISRTDTWHYASAAPCFLPIRSRSLLLAPMAQPAPLGMVETEGWWAAPEPIVVLPVVVASECGHTSSGTTVSADTFTISAARMTHCNSCVSTTATPIANDPVARIPTVVGSVCRHALSGSSTPIGPNTILATVTTLCASCSEFAKIADETASCYAFWREVNSQRLAFYLIASLLLRRYTARRPSTTAVLNTALYKRYVSRRKALARRYERSRLAYERAVRHHQETNHSTLPVVNKHGVALFPSLAYETEPVVRPRKKQATLHRVRFQEDQEHPSQETARKKDLFYRRQCVQGGKKRDAYEPGWWADQTGNGWEDTSKPVLYHDRVPSSDDAYMRSFDFEERSWWETEPDKIGEGSQQYETQKRSQKTGIPAKGSTTSKIASPGPRCEGGLIADAKDVQKALEDYFDFVFVANTRDRGWLSGMSLPKSYTQSSPPSQPEGTKRDPVWTLPESEK